MRAGPDQRNAGMSPAKPKRGVSVATRLLSGSWPVVGNPISMTMAAICVSAPPFAPDAIGSTCFEKRHETSAGEDWIIN